MMGDEYDTSCNTWGATMAGNAPRADSVIIAGAGPAGLAAALALAGRGVRSVVLDMGNGTPRAGSRACGLEASTLAFVYDLTGTRLDGAAEPWGVQRIRRRGRDVPQPVAEPEAPVRYGLSQQRLERALLDAAHASPLVTTAWRHRIEGVEQDETSVTVLARGPGGPVRFRAQWLVGCDGPRSVVRRAVDVRFPGRPRVDRLLCADVKVRLPRRITATALVPPDPSLADEPTSPDLGGPATPWLFVDPPFHRGGTVLAQPLPDDVWRLTWQLPMAHGVAKAAEETRVIPVTGDPADPKRIAARVRSVLRTLDALSPEPDASEDPAHDLLWSGEYEVHQRLARRFRVGRVLLAGDAAHLVHPSAADAVELGLQDVRNLAWKLAFTLRGYAPIRLLETYHGERRGAARRRLALGEDALHFLAPASPAQKVGRRLTLMGARGKGTTLRRLDPRGPAASTSGPDYAGSPLLTPGPGVGEWIRDVEVFRADGAEGWLSECLDRGLVVLLIAPGIQVWHGDGWREAGLMPRLRGRLDKLAAPAELVVTPDYPGATAHTILLIRPDGYIAAHLPPENLDILEESINRARGAGH